MNQPPKRPGGEQPGPFRKKTGGTITFWALILLIMVFLSRAFDSEPAEERLSYTEYRELIEGESPEIRKITVIADDVAPLLRAERSTVSGDFAEPVTRTFTVLLPQDLRPEMELWQAKKIPFDFEERQTNWVANLAITILPWVVFFGVWIYIMRRMQGGGNKGVFNFGKSRAKMMSENQVKVTFKDVAGADEAKEELQEVIEFLKDPKKFSRLGGRIPKGALMLGPPGTGKTLLARAVAGEAGVPFFSMSGADFVEMFVGVGASRVRDLFEQGKKSAPCIIFIDEIDAVGRQRGAGLGGGHDEREQTLNQLLVEMDGFESNDGVILIAATNRPDVLDPALMRPGRFDRQIVVDRPDARGREGILKVHAKRVPLAEDVNLETVAKGTPGLAGADLANIVNEAALIAARRSASKVAMQDFEEARDKVLMGTARKSMVLTEEDRRITAWHEAGHALMSLLIPAANNLHKVTIIPRGRALGLTWQLPEDKVHQTRAQLLAELRVLYGGREAEQLVFGEITTGAISDIRRATQIAETMVCEVGMSDKLGLRSYGKKQEEIFLGREIAQHRDFSEATAELIDSEINRILEEARSETAALLSENREKLDLLAEALLVHEILDADQIRRVLDGEELEAPVEEKQPSDDELVEQAIESARRHNREEAEAAAAARAAEQASAEDDPAEEASPDDDPEQRA